ncbi:MAG: hypothetical protein EBR82_88635 [Caulobacteraceae bacterium]|nr:hypothetical protein [Caulobacteraceae bacterium]
MKPDTTRQYRVGYIELPKKMGKSTTLAGIALYGLVADGEPGAEIYGAACDREQAGIIYREAASMVRSSPALSKRLEVIDSRKTIIDRTTNSFYRVLSADAFRAEGLNIHMLLFDELHAAAAHSLDHDGGIRSQEHLLGAARIRREVHRRSGVRPDVLRVHLRRPARLCDRRDVEDAESMEDREPFAGADDHRGFVRCRRSRSRAVADEAQLIFAIPAQCLDNPRHEVLQAGCVGRVRRLAA